MTKIDTYTPGTEEKIIKCWNKILYRDPISLDVFERKILIDPNFDENGFFIAEKDEEVLGFVVAFKRKYPIYYQEIEKDTGWINVIAFRDNEQGLEIGEELLKKVFDWFKENKIKNIYYSSYIPNYFTPGIDYEAYPHIYRTLLKIGFREIYEALAMDASLWPQMKYPDNIADIVQRLEKENIKIMFLETKYLRSFIKFMEKYMPADWYRHALELLQRNRKKQIIIAVKKSEVIGYCQYWNDEGYEWYSYGAHFGPFGVREEDRGKGIGTVLLYTALSEMKKRGIHNAFVLWTDGKAARLYSRFGFKITRRFKVMKKVL